MLKITEENVKTYRLLTCDILTGWIKPHDQGRTQIGGPDFKSELGSPYKKGERVQETNELILDSKET